MLDINWFAFEDLSIIDRGTAADPTFSAMQEITCMDCRELLTYGMLRVIQRLTGLLEQVGHAYVLDTPLIHGKRVTESSARDGICNEQFAPICAGAYGKPYSYFVDVQEEPERITCLDCIRQVTKLG
ncbi:MAG: hypothetical protein OXL37_10430 [Chloroflexota bacterium]|nr:hypothetical protein [Chloroflexota bacterium]MDE2960565.1 hypothetical protein [Chloroflexota bacterium]